MSPVCLQSTILHDIIFFKCCRYLSSLAFFKFNFIKLKLFLVFRYGCKSEVITPVRAAMHCVRRAGRRQAALVLLPHGRHHDSSWPHSESPSRRSANFIGVCLQGC